MGNAKFSVIIKASINGRHVFMDRFSTFPVTIGRDPSCEVSLPDMTWLSGRNTSLVITEGMLELVDLDSSNGTYIGNQKINRYPISGHETVKIGKLKIELLVTSITEDSIKFETLEQYKNETQTEEVNDPEFDDRTSNIDKTELTEMAERPKQGLFQVGPQDKVESEKQNANQKPAQQPKPVAQSARPPEDDEPTVLDPTRFKPPLPTDDEFDDEETVGRDFPRDRSQGMNVPEYPGSEATAVTEPFGNGPRQPLMSAGEQTEVTRPMNIQPSWGMNFMQRVPMGKLALEATLKWRGQTIENHVYYEGESVYLNGQPDDGVHLPSLKSRLVPVAVFRGDHTKAILPSSCRGEFFDGETGALKKTMEPTYDRKNKGFRFSRDEFRVHFQNDLSLHFRHIESPKPFSQIRFLLPERLFQKALASSGFLHFVIVVIGFLAFPAPPAPKVKNLPPRIAKLLVKKPQPKPKPVAKKEKPKPKPEKKKIAKKPKPKKPKPKKVVKRKPPKVKPKKVVVRKSKKLKKLNKYPFTVKTKRVAKAPSRGAKVKKTNVKKVGALAALGALGKSSPKPSQKPVAININKNAGGSPGKMKANSVIGALKQKGGKLVAGGLGSVKTKGKGYGTGTGYGVQGIKGRAGSRGVAATVVGEPSLMKLRESEGLTQRQVMDVVRKYSGKISSCYERALLDNPSLSGRVEYEWKIRPAGSVQWAKVKASNVSGADSLNKCVVGVFRGMKFPKAKNGQSTLPSIGFPFGRL
ncbi:MAG: AgmX/PglI C-terminal domain-containing protein [Bdellovibrionales bacterium]|nr:AgmX/PglI C-terminal domain-containing protein [Bdellovibrionales bacterium]